jgi:hypothetical protein
MSKRLYLLRLRVIEAVVDEPDRLDVVVADMR